MNLSENATGQAVFIRTDVLEYLEINFPFQTLEEMVKICSEPKPGLTLERVIVFSLCVTGRIKRDHRRSNQTPPCWAVIS